MIRKIYTCDLCKKDTYEAEGFTVDHQIILSNISDDIIKAIKIHHAREKYMGGIGICKNCSKKITEIDSKYKDKTKTDVLEYLKLVNKELVADAVRGVMTREHIEEKIDSDMLRKQTIDKYLIDCKI